MNFKFWQKEASPMGEGTADPRVEQKSAIPFYYLGDAGPGTLGDWMYGGCSRLSPQQAASFYRTSSAVAIAIDTIADEAEKIMPVLEIDGVITDEGDVLDLLKKPNPYQMRQQFIGHLIRDWLLNHDTSMAAAGNLRAPPSSIYAIDSQRVSGTQSARNLPYTYNVSTGIIQGNFRREIDRNRIRYVDGPIKEFYHLKGYSSRPDSLWGDSPLEAALIEAKQQISGRNHNLKLLQNGARLSLVAVFKDPLGEGELAQRRQALNEQMAGSNNAGKIAVVSSDDLEFKEMGTNNKDMDFALLDETAFKTIMMRYKIPLPLISDGAQTDNNFSEAVFQLYDRAVLPAFDFVMSGIGDFLLPRYGLDPSRVRITFDPEAIESLRERTLTNLLKRRELNIETINELRSDLPDRDDIPNGDVIYQSATLVPIGEGIGSETDLNNTDDAAGREAEEDTTDAVETEE